MNKNADNYKILNINNYSLYYQIIYVLIDKILAEIKENCNYVSMSKFTESRFESDHFEIMFIPLTS